MKFKTNNIGFGNSKLLHIGYDLIPGGLIITAIGYLALIAGGTWYKAVDEKSEENIELLSDMIENSKTK